MSQSAFQRVAIVGATGAVGRELIAVLEQREFPLGELLLFASPRSAGALVSFRRQELAVRELGTHSLSTCDLAFFSAGAAVSRSAAPAAARCGTIVIDNSSAFRMEAGTPLVVPEINPQDLREHRGIIANPNCSTIILLMPLWPLHRMNRVRRVVVATYQAASGAGARAMNELTRQTADVLAGRPPRPEVFALPCAFNVFSHNSAIGADGLNVEESKMIEESRKILGEPELAVSPTCLRVPVLRSHLEAVAVEFADPIDPDEARGVLHNAPGVRVVDDRDANHFPTSLAAAGQDDVLVGRIRRDRSVPDQRGLSFLCAGDQLRKGAALNAVQIAERLLQLRASAS